MPRDGTPSPAELWQRYHAAGPGDASEEELLKRFLPLVKTVVGRVAMTLPPHVDMDDISSAGVLGLLNALRLYEPRCNVPFEAYARIRIRGAVLDELRRMDWVPRAVHAKARNVQAAQDELEQRFGRLPEDHEMAAALKLSAAEYEQLLEEIRPATFICLDAVCIGGKDDRLEDNETFADETQPDPKDEVSRHELTELIAERLQTLPQIHQRIIALYYFEDLRVREIAEACGLSPSRVSQLHTQAILAIRAHVEHSELAAAKRQPGVAA
jgi:RNA polymerase sigma factor for flagellar operon FliA